MKSKALQFLRKSLNNPHAHFREGQWESIEQLLAHKKMLVVQRTGWGKSVVYFLTTKLMRLQGSGPALLISPLLSLMRNQLEAASRLGLEAQTINSTNSDEWKNIHNEIAANRIDILLISPERLANDKFRQEVLGEIADKIGLFVIDEAHCISDWGHDFRPDYRRIVRVLQTIPPNVPVLATTATANDRVVHDIISQLGEGVELARGPLVRESLRLQNIIMRNPVTRMAWLVQTIPNLPGSGIVYTLTQRDAERLATWLQINNIKAKAYHADLPPRQDGTSVKEELEQQLLNNEIKVLVATVALGMGFDKPDLGFVIHFQRPASVVHYYQQVGRAGRAVDEAYGILLSGEEDERIADFFIRNAFPPQQHIVDILKILDESDEGLSVPSLESRLNLKKSQIDKTLKFLTVETPSPVTKVGSKWRATISATTYEFDQDLVNKITLIRQQEQEQMNQYLKHRGCLMAFLERALDDPHPAECGKCKNCNPKLLLSEEYNDELANRAAVFLKRSHHPIEPRKQWPANNPMPLYGFKGKIKDNLRASEGRSLCLWRDAGWGRLVAKGKNKTGQFDDSLIDACCQMLSEWGPTPFPKWVTCVPSHNHPLLLPNFTEKLAAALSLPFFPCIQKVKQNRLQREMGNSFQQVQNLDGAFHIDLAQQAYSSCLLVDDMVDSRWTFTVVAALLRQVGCEAVHPLALALNSPRMD